MFDRSGLRVCRSLPVVLFLASVLLLSLPAWAQDEAPTTGTIQGTVKDDSGVPVDAARIFYSSSVTDTRGVTRTGKDGVYVSEPLPPGPYTVRVEGRDMLPVEMTVNVTVTAPATADFTLEWINPGPDRLQSSFSGDVPDSLPLNGRHSLAAGALEPGVQDVDGKVLDRGKSGFQGLSINNQTGRTTHYDADEVEVMDETRGGSTLNLPAEAVREVIVSRATPELFQSLNATGAVRISTRSGGDEWHGNLFGAFRDRVMGMAGFPTGSPKYSRQHYGFGGGGALIQDKMFVYLSGERTKQDGHLPFLTGFPAFNNVGIRNATFRENMLVGRLDYNLSENMKWFARISYDNANGIGPSDSGSNYRNQINVPGAVVGLDWNHGSFLHSARFGYQKMVNAVTPDLASSVIFPVTPFQISLGSYQIGPNNAGPRQTIQRDLFGRYDSRTTYRGVHTLRFGAAIHRIDQGDYYLPGNHGPRVTSSNGIDVINAINSNPNLVPLYPNDPRGAADDPRNYPVGTITIYNGLGSFSEHSGFNHSTGAHVDTRFEGYLGDTFNVFPNLNVTVGVTYVRDSGRTNSDLAGIPCSAINTTIVKTPPCTSGLILDQFGYLPNGAGQRSLGGTINQPDWNFAPQAGVAWDPGHSGRTVFRASGGMFFDNFLLQNSYQDRINRLSRGQYNRSLKLCPTGSVLFPDGSIVNSVDGLDIATQVCGQPIGAVADAIEDLQSQFVAAQAAVPAGAPNVYSLANSVANFGGLLAPSYKTPRIVHMSGGFEHKIGEHGLFAADYVRELGTQFPLGIDTNHVGDFGFLTDGSNPNPLLNTYQTELNAINATVVPVGCPAATFAGSSSQASVACYLATVPGASITDFARNGLDSANAYCGPFPCAVLGKPRQAAFGGINPSVGSNVMFFPSGRSQYQALHLTYRGTVLRPSKTVSRVDFALNYAWSRYRTNIAGSDGSGGDYSVLTVAQDYNRPHRNRFGASGLDRTHQLSFTGVTALPHGLKLSMIANLASPLPLSAFVPQQDGGGVAGEIFRSDLTGDGTTGDPFPGFLGSTGKYSTSKLANLISFYNQTYAGKLTPAGIVLAATGLVSAQQLVDLGAYSPFVQALPGHYAEATWLKNIDLRLNWPIHVGERAIVEPTVSVFNALNFANFGGAGNQLSGILNGAPGSSLNNASSAGFCGNSPAFCSSRLDRVVAGSGTFSSGAPRQLEFGVKISF